MKKTVLITGTSSGIGKETALYFADRGWNVIATMRRPEGRETGLLGKAGIDLVHLDVTDVGSVRDAIRFAVEKYGRLDVVVNNAGYAAMGAFEASTAEHAKRQLETNVIGLMDVVREIIPVFRSQKGGIVINVASIGGRVAFPLYSIYQASKWAVEGFSEALQFELRPFGIKIKIIEPGIIKTDFYERSLDVMRKEGLDIYDGFIDRALKNMSPDQLGGSPPSVVARTIYRAANDKSWKLRYSTGKNAWLMLGLRKILPDSLFDGLLRTMLTR